MTLVRRIARPLLASVFVSGGIDTLRHPGPRVQAVEKLNLADTTLAKKANIADNAQLVQVNAAVQIVAGLALATSRAPRLAATALAASVVPTTAAGHRFWEEKDPASRKAQQTHFLKNLGLLGGLLLAAVDTEGRESLPRRARRGAQATRRGAERARLKAELRAEQARRRAERRAVKSAAKAAATADLAKRALPVS